MSDPAGSSAEGAELVELGDAAPPRPLRQRVRELLAEGQLVALPTETVYGIAARADDPRALDRLRALKGREAQVPLTWHVAQREAAQGWSALGPLVARLTERYWPGPLTLVLHGTPPGLGALTSEGWTGIRLPAHRATRGLLEALDFPVVLSSANRSGHRALTEAGAVAEAFPELPLVVDGGTCRLGEASAVARVGPGRFELLREGLLSLDDLRGIAGRRLAFVCTGNTCRSPMAEGIARQLITERLTGEGGAAMDPADFGFHVQSAGVAAGPGAPASGHAVEVLAGRGIDLTGHRSSPADPDELSQLDEVYCLTASHLARLRELVPGRQGRRFQLLDPAGHDVPDPIGGSLADYAACAEAIRRAIEVRAEHWC